MTDCRAARLLVLLGFVLLGCSSNHHVSPWPRVESFQPLMTPSSLEEQLERVASEMQSEGLTLVHEVCGRFDDVEGFCIRGYEGHDDLGHERNALRVATRYGVVMALGPPSAEEAARGEGISWVVRLADRWDSGTDINDDGMPDVVVVRASKGLEIWGLHYRGASPYPMDGVVPMTEAMDIDGDGRPELMAAVPTRAEPVKPQLVEILEFKSGRYRPDTPLVRRYHAVKGEAMRDMPTEAAAVQMDWHRFRAGEDVADVLKALDERIARMGESSKAVRASLRRWRNWLASTMAEERRGRE
jgi:hypothetical protein